MEKGQIWTVVLVSLVVAVIASVATSSITANTIRVAAAGNVTDVYTKAEVQSLLKTLKANSISTNFLSTDGLSADYALFFQKESTGNMRAAVIDPYEIASFTMSSSQEQAAGAVDGTLVAASFNRKGSSNIAFYLSDRIQFMGAGGIWTCAPNNKTGAFVCVQASGLKAPAAGATEGQAYSAANIISSVKSKLQQ